MIAALYEAMPDFWSCLSYLLGQPLMSKNEETELCKPEMKRANQYSEW